MARREIRAGERLRARGEEWQVERCVPYDEATMIDVRGCDRSNGGERARFLLPFEPIDCLPRRDAPRIVTPAAWRRAARRLLGQAAAHAASLRAAVAANVDIVPFQLEPALALVRGEASRFLIADAVGMGKTVQAGLLLAARLSDRPDDRALIVTPAGLREQWREELRDRFAVHAELLDAAGVARASARLPESVNPWSAHGVVLTSIDYLKRPEVMRSLETLIWDVVIFDEAHALAGRSDRAAAAHAVAQRARAVVMLTATPHSGDEDAFRRLCAIGQLDGDPPLAIFRRTRVDAGLDLQRRTSMLRVRPTAAEVMMHQALLAYARLVWKQAGASNAGARLAMTVLMRRASSSPWSLARSLERRHGLIAGRPAGSAAQAPLPFGDAEDEAPDAVLSAPGLADARSERVHLQRLVELAGAAAPRESKLHALQRLLARSNEPLIVFTEYRDTLQRLSHVEPAAVQLHGGLTARERSEALKRFTSGAVRVLLATDAASEGLNLHHRCRVVVNLELPWTPLRLEQRVGRVDRIGQRRRVHAIQLVAAGTSEETVLARLVDRASRVERAMRTLVQLPDERSLAACILAGGPLPDIRPATEGAGRGTVDLRREALAEASRLADARRLSGVWDAPVPRTAVATRIRSRIRRPLTPACYWLFRLLLADRSGRRLTELAVPITALASTPPGRSFLLAQRLLNPGHHAIQRALNRQALECLEQNGRLEKAIAGLWIAREQAIAGRLRHLHARLSAAVQPDLFPNRRHTAAAARMQLVAETLASSEERLRELADRLSPQVDACDLLFAVSLE